MNQVNSVVQVTSGLNDPSLAEGSLGRVVKELVEETGLVTVRFAVPIGIRQIPAEFLTTPPTHAPGTLEEMVHNRVVNSIIETMTSDPQETAKWPNTTAREVFSGHFVRCATSPISSPHLVVYSRDMATSLGLNPTTLADNPNFVKLFSGDLSQFNHILEAWATPYALSIMGSPIDPSPDPFGTGNGYGDGRALSIMEIVEPTTKQRWELQLKGAGPTPFCRTADGRAVMRSSVREFLVSEGMHHLGVPTTRALSLVASSDLQVERGWFLEGSNARDNQILVDEPAAVLCRVCRSFIRVGNFELHARRAVKGLTSTDPLRAMLKNCIEREYPDATGPLEVFRACGQRLANLVSNWIRVGYCQGNFNADNCLVGGYTMDYGPFGFIERYDPEWCMWVGGGRHFAFMNQPTAAFANYVTFGRSLVPLIDSQEEMEALNRMLAVFREEVMPTAMKKMWAKKLGVADPEVAGSLWAKLEKLMRLTTVDYTILFRQLSYVVRDSPADPWLYLADAFYTDDSTVKAPNQKEWEQWLQEWLSFVGTGDVKATAAKVMLQEANPKYVPREWMLIAAYKRAQKMDYRGVFELQDLFLNPYAEGTEDQQKRFYKKASVETKDLAGCSHMTCAS